MNFHRDCVAREKKQEANAERMQKIPGKKLKKNLPLPETLTVSLPRRIVAGNGA
jgi:hypothetical protein